MAPTPGSLSAEAQVLEAAKAGDQQAFERLVAPYRAELHAHCYRITGSLHDAEDALQEALLRAWRGLARFEGRAKLRSWLYTIATNASLTLVGKRPSRVHPLDHGPAATPGDPFELPLAEVVWIEPYPDGPLGLEDGHAAPDTRYELRESVELASSPRSSSCRRTSAPRSSSGRSSASPRRRSPRRSRRASPR